MWQRDGNEGFAFVNAESQEEAIESWIAKQSGWHEDGRLYKMIITETNNTYKVPLEMTDYFYGEDVGFDY